MQKGLSDGSTKRGHGRNVTRRLTKRTRAACAAYCLLAIVLMFAGCGGGGGEGVSSQTVRGVAATGAPLAGQVKMKDSSTLTREKSTVIANDGSFALDVSDMKAPFVLQATGTANGTSYTLHSFADGPGTANINPLSDAAVANAAGVSDPAQVYEHPDSATLQKIKDNLSNAVTELQDTLKPLLKNFSADKNDPVKDHYKADHTGLDGLFDNVQITIISGTITVTNLKTGAVIYTGPISDLRNGHFTEDDDDLPNPGAMPTTPTRIKATGGDSQVTVTWKSVGNAISYNIYWSETPGVTTTNGTKIPGAKSPYVQTGLSAGTAYYYVVTAVNSAGEGAVSSEATATTNATGTSDPLPSTAPGAPTGVMATGGTKQATIAWSMVTDATSYNIYWSKTDGVTTTTGTKIAGATSPTVQIGLMEGTTYYYIITAVNGNGESAASIQVAATPLASIPSTTIPAAPTDVAASGGAKLVTVSWSPVTGATSYNIYWSTATGVTTAPGTNKITGASSPYNQTGLADNTAYYYIVTAMNSAGEGAASAQVSATTNVPPAVTCGACHAIPPVTGQHARHVDQLAYSCSVCHGTGYSSTTVNSATHADSLINLMTSLNWTGTTCSPGCHTMKSW